MKTQKSGKDSSKPIDPKTEAQDMKQEDLKKVKGGSGLLSGGNDLTNIIQGGVGITNSSSGSNGDDSYTSTDSHTLDLGLGNMLNNTNF